MIRYLITNRRAAGGRVALLNRLASLLASEPWLVQVREKDLSARELLHLVRDVLALPRLPDTRILVNSRVDVALAAGAHGAHLPAHSPEAAIWRAVTPPGFLFGVSCHGPSEVTAAERGGADFAVFGPVFETPGKGPATGLPGLRDAVRAASLPVLALGGVTPARVPDCLAAGVAGVAGIRLFLAP